MDEPINIEVAYATPAKQSLIELTVPKGSTVEQGILNPVSCEFESRCGSQFIK